MNFIYLNPDQMRADFLGCYGHPSIKTPNIDALAAGGVRFDQCAVQHTVCSPSRCSFMTGWYPHVRGHRSLWSLLQPDEPNTLKYLKQNGYDVHWIGKNDLLAQESFEDSVTELHFPQRGASGDRNIFDKDQAEYWSFLYGPADDHTADWYKIEKAVEFLHSRKPDDPPFMLYLPISYPHCPFTCPEKWYDMYDASALTPMRQAEAPDKPVFHRLLKEYRGLDRLDAAVFEKIRAVYMGMISYVDEMVGRLLKALDETGLADSTSFFFFSDHGEWAGDYGLVEKWHGALDDCLTRVPMIVRTPDCVPGHVVTDPVECFDIMPTTLELAGIECRHTHYAHSMIPQLAGAPGDPERAAFAEGGYDPNEPHCYEGTPDDIGADTDMIYYPKGRIQQEHPEASVRCTMIRTKEYKLIYRPAEISELYDLRQDPLEERNRYGHPEYEQVQRDLERRILDWYIHTSDAVPYHRDPRGYSQPIAEEFSQAK